MHGFRVCTEYLSRGNVIKDLKTDIYVKIQISTKIIIFIRDIICI